MENKLLISMIAPISTKSGYGERGRDIARAIIKSGKYDLKIWPINWGMTPFTGLNPNDPEDRIIMDCILDTPNLQRKPDIHLHLSVPNEFQPLGKYNIGITAGIETDHVDASWLEGCNRMDLILVSSEHAKKGFTDTVYKNDTTGNIMTLEKPIEVLFEGLDTSVFFKTSDIDSSIENEMKNISEDFVFLFCGHWLQGDIGQDRKDVGMLIKTFFEAFKNKKKKPALLLKTSGGGTSITDKKNILDKIDAIRKSCGSEELPNVYLLHGNMTRSEMNSLYNHPKIKANVSFTKGEGFGRPLLECSVSAKPIIVTKHSGHVDFLEHVVWLPGKLTPIHPSAQWQGILNPGTQWFTCDYGYAGGILRDVFENYKNYTDLGKRQAYKSKNEFNIDLMAKKLIEHLDVASSKLPRQVELKLPKLKKIELPKMEKIEEEVKDGN